MHVWGSQLAWGKLCMHEGFCFVGQSRILQLQLQLQPCKCDRLIENHWFLYQYFLVTYDRSFCMLIFFWFNSFTVFLHAHLLLIQQPHWLVQRLRSVIASCPSCYNFVYYLPSPLFVIHTATKTLVCEKCELFYNHNL